MSDKMTIGRFLHDVDGHKLTIHQDQGVFRHIRFAKPGTYCMSFMLTTWPGHLAISGDMGTFVFNRVEDMFTFFRTKPGGWGSDEQVYINPGYWSEKCEAQDTRSEGIREFDRDTFRDRVKECWEEYYEGREECDEALECWDELEYSVLGSENLFEAHAALNDFKHVGFRFHDSWEWGLTSATPRYLWCCYAIAWGIQQYDAALDPKPQEVEP